MECSNSNPACEMQPPADSRIMPGLRFCAVYRRVNSCTATVDTVDCAELLPWWWQSCRLQRAERQTRLPLAPGGPLRRGRGAVKRFLAPPLLGGYVRCAPADSSGPPDGRPAETTSSLAHQPAVKGSW